MKLWKILLVVLTGIIVLFVIALFIAARSNPKQFALGRGKALRSEAKIILKSAHYNIVAYQRTQKRYSDNPDVAFNGGAPFTCKTGSHCLHYLYAVQASCENGGKPKVSRQSELALIGQSDSKLVAMGKALEQFAPICKSISQGFNVLAVGDIIEDGLFDIVSLDEAGTEIKIIQDAPGSIGK